jgi:probable F420-dependent oxidoreductase
MSQDRPFRFGVHTSKANDGDTWASAARRYEDLGFSSLLLRDHFDDQLAPIAAMTAAACSTSRLRVGCLVHDNDYRHPLVLAKELASLDVLSGGRVEVGLGAGWMAPDYEQSGIPFDAPAMRVTRLQEGLRVMKGCFADGSFDFEGEHYRIVGHDALPKPVQHPHPPFLVGGGGRRVLGFAAREADIIALSPRRRSNEEWADQNVADATAEATDAKLAWIRQAAGDRYGRLELSIVVPFVIVTDERDATAATIATGLDTGGAGLEASAGNVLASPYVLIGSVDQLVDTLRERRERWDLSYVVVNDDSVDAIAPVIEQLSGT